MNEQMFPYAFGYSTQHRKRLRDLIKKKALILSEEEGFSLASGGQSTFFFDMKTVSLDPEGAHLTAEAIIDAVQNEDVDYIGGLESGAIPLIAAVCEKSWSTRRPISGFYVRKEPKKRGTMKLIEGNLEKNSKVIILDDVTTKGESALKAVNEVRRLGCVVDKVITVVDRLEGARENLAQHQITLISLFTRDDFGI